MRIRIYPYNSGSESAMALSEHTGFKRVKHKNSKFKPTKDDVIINWGHRGDALDSFNCTILNEPRKVAVASCKLATFELLSEHEVSVPNFTTDPKEVKLWLDAGREIVARTKLNGSSGEGIVIINRDRPEIVSAPLYSMYIPKKEEYRVHVMDGKVFDIQRKIRDPEKNVTGWHIRNHSSGFIFVRNDIRPNQDVIDQSLKAIQSMCLDFGAVDVIFNSRHQKAYVLEVNTAPGLVGQTATSYAEAFKEKIGVN